VSLVSIGRIHKKGEVELSDLLEAVRKKIGEEVGALGCFVGIVRGISKNDEKVTALEYEAAEEAAETLTQIATEVQQKFGLSEVQIHHVIDKLKPGEDAIYVIACGKHRKEVFQALSEAMELVKSKAPIWKKEITTSGGRWI